MCDGVPTCYAQAVVSHRRESGRWDRKMRLRHPVVGRVAEMRPERRVAELPALSFAPPPPFSCIVKYAYLVQPSIQGCVCARAAVLSSGCRCLGFCDGVYNLTCPVRRLDLASPSKPKGGHTEKEIEREGPFVIVSSARRLSQVRG